MARAPKECLKALHEKLAAATNEDYARSLLDEAEQQLVNGDSEGLRRSIDRLYALLYDGDLPGTGDCVELLNGFSHNPVAA